MLNFLKRTLMGVPYEYETVAPNPPRNPLVPKPLFTPEAEELIEHERVIQHRRRDDAHQGWLVLSKTVIGALQSYDAVTAHTAKAVEATSAARQARVIQDEFADFPVLSCQPRSRQLTVQEEMAAEIARKRQLKINEELYAPVSRRIAA